MTLTYFSRSWGSILTWKLSIFACKHDNSTNISRIGPKLIPWMCLKNILVKFRRWMTLTYFSRSWRSVSTWKFEIFACKHDNSTNISCIGPKLIPCMYLRNILVTFEDGWTWLIFRGHRGRFQHEKFAIFTCKHDNFTNISRIGPQLIPCMYLRNILLTFEDGWTWLIFRGRRGRFQHENCHFRL